RGAAGDHRRLHQLHRGHLGRTDRPESQVLTMGTATLPASNKSWVDKLPIISHLKMSSGLQRGMLISGLALTGLFLIAAIFAPLIAPFDFAQSGNANGDFPRQAAPGGDFIWGTTSGGYDVFSRTIFGAQT